MWWKSFMDVTHMFIAYFTFPFCYNSEALHSYNNETFVIFCCVFVLIFVFFCRVLNCFQFVTSLFHIFPHDILSESMFRTTLCIYYQLQEFFGFYCNKSQPAHTTKAHCHFLFYFTYFFTIRFHPPQHSSLLSLHSLHVKFICSCVYVYFCLFFLLPFFCNCFNGNNLFVETTYNLSK